LAIGNEHNLIITDTTLPEIHGLELFNEIRRAKPSIAIIVHTALGYLNQKDYSTS
jgi:YesN/AraC family two-component response regulator